jgi:hypothetical protein
VPCVTSARLDTTALAHQARVSLALLARHLLQELINRVVCVPRVHIQTQAVPRVTSAHLDTTAHQARVVLALLVPTKLLLGMATMRVLYAISALHLVKAVTCVTCAMWDIHLG